jgi:tetratricopeptide (TPR) repeat protein
MRPRRAGRASSSALIGRSNSHPFSQVLRVGLIRPPSVCSGVPYHLARFLHDMVWLPSMSGRVLVTLSTILLMLLSACSALTPSPTIRPALTATTCKPASVTQSNQVGIALYTQHRFEAAKTKFTEAVAQGPKCAEAHYNLGLSLSYLGEKEEARVHFLEAANLAPGNQVIWDSPALRPYGDPQKEKKTTKTAAEQAPGAFSNRSRMGY